LVLEKHSGPVLVIEGEVNALSFQSAVPEFRGTIASPGSCNEFERHTEEILTLGKSYVIIVDKDKPGVISGLRMKKDLINRGKKVTLYAFEKDFNEILQDEGPEALHRWAKENLGM
jgi:DNA primase